MWNMHSNFSKNKNIFLIILWFMPDNTSGLIKNRHFMSRQTIYCLIRLAMTKFDIQLIFFVFVFRVTYMYVNFWIFWMVKNVLLHLINRNISKDIFSKIWYSATQFTFFQVFWMLTPDLCRCIGIFCFLISYSMYSVVDTCRSTRQNIKLYNW